MTSSTDSMRRAGFDGDLGEMELIGTNLFTIGVAAEADPEFKAFVMAAGSTYAAGNSSIDNTLRKHKSMWIESFEKKAEVDREGAVGLRAALLREVSARCVGISNLVLNTSSSGIVAAGNALIRMDAAFRAASRLIQSGFAFESEAVIRLGFEQVAWSNAVRHLSELEDVAKLSGTGHTTKLKALFPGAGPIYNRLSNLAHVAPSTRARVMIEDDNKLMIHIQAPQLVKESMQLLVILLDAFLVVSEACFGQMGIPSGSFDSLTKRPKEDRPARRLIQEFEGVFPPGTNAFFDAWWR